MATVPPNAYLQFPFQEERAERDDVLFGEGLIIRLVLGHLIFQGDETDRWAFLLLQAEELQDALVVVQVAVNVDEEDLGGQKELKA